MVGEGLMLPNREWRCFLLEKLGRGCRRSQHAKTGGLAATLMSALNLPSLVAVDKLN